MKITDYEFGRIGVEGKTYTSDVIIYPEKVRDSWWRKEGHRLHLEDLEEVISAKPELLIVGTGYYGNMVVPKETLTRLESEGIKVRVAPTGEAVKLFNQLQREAAVIVAALHLTC